MIIKWLVSGLLLMASANFCCAADGPKSLTVSEGFTNPLGFHDATPTFSWMLPDGVKSQTTYQIEVTDLTTGEIVWDSEWVDSDQSHLVPYEGKPLESRQRLNWRARFCDEVGKESAWSDVATFEMGLLSSSDWKAQWIRPADEPGGKFELVKAVYRSVANPDRSNDVTELLRKSSPAKPLPVDNKTLGGDPALGEVKELVLSYTHDGSEKSIAYGENKEALFPPAKEHGEPVATLRRDFPLSKDVAHARLYVTARGVFDLHLNGQRVGSDYFANGWTSYAQRMDTVTYDVTDQLNSGDNKLVARLGMGWYAGRLAWKHAKQLYGKKPELLLQLEITSKDGSVQTIVSDDAWQGTHEGPVVSSSIYDGETYDARKAGVSDAQFLPVIASPDLGSAALTPKPFAPVRAIETLAVQKITQPEPGRFVFDLGQNMVGWAKLKIPVQKDQTVTIRFAEMLNQDGTMYTENYRSAKSIDHYIAAETGTIEWEPVFTFHGFRYVELSGLPADVDPQTNWVQGIVLHSDLPKIGTFESSHAKLNQLQRNIVWGQRGNFLDIPTDCPQRDERLGWTGDAQAFCPAACFNYDCHAFFKSWLESMRHDQFDDGRIPHVIPDILKGAGSPGWMDAATIIPWDVYVRTGDLELLSQNYEMMERLVGWYRKQSKNNLISKMGGFGDWLQPYAKEKKGDTPSPLLGNAFYANSTRILAASARVLGKKSDAKKYEAELDRIKTAFTLHYFDVDGKLTNAPETQTAYLLAIGFNLIPADLQTKAATHLVRLVDEADGHLRTGFLGTPFIAHVLDRMGHSDLAYSVLFKETYPSWFYSINQGATTMWERWNSYSHEDGFGDVSMNSFNHYAYGAIGQWMVERVAGLSPDPAQPGYKHFFVRPIVGGPLTSASADLETPYGRASSGWKKNGDKVVLNVVVPPNTTATVEFPGDRQPETVVAGNHRFEW